MRHESKWEAQKAPLFNTPLLLTFDIPWNNIKLKDNESKSSISKLNLV